MDLVLKGKVAFVAASSDGLGKAVAMELANEGATIIINGRNKAKLESTRKDIEQKFNTKVIAVSGDLADEKERATVLKTIFKDYDVIDILVTNTGGPVSGKFEDLSMRD